MICCWLLVDPVNIGSRIGTMLQPAPSPAVSASRLSWPASFVDLEVLNGTESLVRIAQLVTGIRSFELRPNRVDIALKALGHTGHQGQKSHRAEVPRIDVLPDALKERQPLGAFGRPKRRNEDARIGELL